MRIRPTISHFWCVKARIHVKEREKRRGEEEEGRRKKEEEKNKESKGMKST